MTHVASSLCPLDRFDREQVLMDRLVGHHPTGPDVAPQQQINDLFNALSEIGSLINSRCYGDAIDTNLCTLLVTGAAVARRFGVSLYENDEWPDGAHTRIGGDGARSTGHDPLDLVAQVWEAATWVASFVQDHSTTSAPTATEPAWLTAEPVTELIARTWSLADSLGARGPLRVLIRDHLSAS
jgi:hypothetical protein